MNLSDEDIFSTCDKFDLCNLSPSSNCSENVPVVDQFICDIDERNIALQNNIEDIWREMQNIGEYETDEIIQNTKIDDSDIYSDSENYSYNELLSDDLPLFYEIEEFLDNGPSTLLENTFNNYIESGKGNSYKENILTDWSLKLDNYQNKESYNSDIEMQSYTELMEEKVDDNFLCNQDCFNRVLDWLINDYHTEVDKFDSLDILGGQRFCHENDINGNLENGISLRHPRESILNQNKSPDLFRSTSDENEIYKADIEMSENKLESNSPDLFDMSVYDELSNNNSSNLLNLGSYSDLGNTSILVSEPEVNMIPSLHNISEITESTLSNAKSELSNYNMYNLNVCSENLFEINSHEASFPEPVISESNGNDNSFDSNNNEINLIELNMQNIDLNESFVSCSNINSPFVIELNPIALNTSTQNIVQSNTNESSLNENTIEELNCHESEYLFNRPIRTDLCEANLHGTINATDFNQVIEPTGNLSLRQQELMNQVRNLINNLHNNLNETGSAHLFVTRTNWSNILYENGRLNLNRNGSVRKISSSNRKRRFSIIMYLLSEIYSLLSTGFTCNLRELYYKNPNLCKNQENVCNALKDICCYLNTTPWELKILSTSKGLIAGPIRFITNDNEIIDCNNSLQNGTLIPYDLTNNFEVFDSDAKFILIVEKDTVFQKLLQHNVLSKLGELFILITGKGYPDMNTRLMINKITAKFNLPVYILVDGDPFGIEIMLTYKYGSKTRAFNSQELACTKIEWIGLYPSEIDLLSLPSILFNQEDTKKINILLRRPYLDQLILSELEIFSQMNRKAEIEAITENSVDFFINDYLFKKINTHN